MGGGRRCEWFVPAFVDRGGLRCEWQCPRLCRPSRLCACVLGGRGWSGRGAAWQCWRGACEGVSGFVPAPCALGECRCEWPCPRPPCPFPFLCVVLCCRGVRCVPRGWRLTRVCRLGQCCRCGALRSELGVGSVSLSCIVLCSGVLGRVVLLEERRERCAVARRKICYVMLCYVCSAGHTMFTT